MVRSSTSLTPNQKHHAFFFPEKALFSFSHGNIRDQNLALKKKKEQLVSVSGFFSLCEEKDAKNEEEGDMRTKQPDLCSLTTRIFRVSLLSSLSAVFPFFSALDKRKRRREKRKEQPLRSRVHLRPRTWLLHSTEFFFFFHFSAQLTNFDRQKT